MKAALFYAVSGLWSLHKQREVSICSPLQPLYVESKNTDFKQIMQEIVITIEVNWKRWSGMSIEYLGPFLLNMMRMQVTDRSSPRTFPRVLSLPRQRAGLQWKQQFSKHRVSELQCKVTACAALNCVPSHYCCGTWRQACCA